MFKFLRFKTISGIVWTLRLPLVVVVALACVLRFGCTTGNLERTYRIGFKNSRPRQRVDANGKPAGSTNDILKAAALWAQVKLEWVLVRNGPELLEPKTLAGQTVGLTRGISGRIAAKCLPQSSTREFFNISAMVEAFCSGVVVVPGCWPELRRLGDRLRQRKLRICCASKFDKWFVMGRLQPYRCSGLAIQPMKRRWWTA